MREPGINKNEIKKQHKESFDNCESPQEFLDILEDLRKKTHEDIRTDFDRVVKEIKKYFEDIKNGIDTEIKDIKIPLSIGDGPENKIALKKIIKKLPFVKKDSPESEVTPKEDRTVHVPVTGVVRRMGKKIESIDDREKVGDNVLKDRGHNFFQQKKYKDTINVLRSADFDSLGEEEMYMLAISYKETGGFNQARDLFEMIIAQNPEDSILHNDLGEVFYKEKDNSSALKYFEKAVSLDPDNFPAQYNLARVNKRMNRFSAALNAYQKAFELTNDQEVKDEIGGEMQKMEEKLNEKGLRQAEITNMVKEMEVANSGNNHQRAVELAEQIPEEKRTAKVWYELGVAQHETGDIDAAVESFKKAGDMEPQNKEIIENLADIYQEQGEYRKAISLYKKIEQDNPEEITTLLKIAECYEGTGDEKLTYEYYKKYLDKAKENRAIGTERAKEIRKKIEALQKGENEKELQRFIDSADYGEAITLGEEMLRNRSNDMDLRHKLSSVYEANKQFDKAIEVLQDAVDKGFAKEEDIKDRLEAIKKNQEEDRKVDNFEGLGISNLEELKSIIAKLESKEQNLNPQEREAVANLVLAIAENQLSENPASFGGDAAEIIKPLEKQIKKARRNITRIKEIKGQLEGTQDTEDKIKAIRDEIRDLEKAGDEKGVLAKEKELKELEQELPGSVYLLRQELQRLEKKQVEFKKGEGLSLTNQEQQDLEVLDRKKELAKDIRRNRESLTQLMRDKEKNKGLKKLFNKTNYDKLIEEAQGKQELLNKEFMKLCDAKAGMVSKTLSKEQRLIVEKMAQLEAQEGKNKGRLGKICRVLHGALNWHPKGIQERIDRINDQYRQKPIRRYLKTFALSMTSPRGLITLGITGAAIASGIMTGGLSLAAMGPAMAAIYGNAGVLALNRGLSAFSTGMMVNRAFEAGSMTEQSSRLQSGLLEENKLKDIEKSLKVLEKDDQSKDKNKYRIKDLENQKKIEELKDQLKQMKKAGNKEEYQKLQQQLDEIRGLRLEESARNMKNYDLEEKINYYHSLARDKGITLRELFEQHGSSGEQKGRAEKSYNILVGEYEGRIKRKYGPENADSAQEKLKNIEGYLSGKLKREEVMAQEVIDRERNKRRVKTVAAVGAAVAAGSGFGVGFIAGGAIKNVSEVAQNISEGGFQAGDLFTLDGFKAQAIRQFQINEFLKESIADSISGNPVMSMQTFQLENALGLDSDNMEATAPKMQDMLDSGDPRARSLLLDWEENGLFDKQLESSGGGYTPEDIDLLRDDLQMIHQESDLGVSSFGSGGVDSGLKNMIDRLKGGRDKEAIASLLNAWDKSGKIAEGVKDTILEAANDTKNVGAAVLDAVKDVDLQNIDKADLEEVVNVAKEAAEKAAEVTKAGVELPENIVAESSFTIEEGSGHGAWHGTENFVKNNLKALGMEGASEKEIDAKTLEILKENNIIRVDDKGVMTEIRSKGGDTYKFYADKGGEVTVQQQGANGEVLNAKEIDDKYDYLYKKDTTSSSSRGSADGRSIKDEFMPLNSNSQAGGGENVVDATTGGVGDQAVNGGSGGSYDNYADSYNPLTKDINELEDQYINPGKYDLDPNDSISQEDIQYSSLRHMRDMLAEAKPEEARNLLFQINNNEILEKLQDGAPKNINKIIEEMLKFTNGKINNLEDAAKAIDRIIDDPYLSSFEKSELLHNPAIYQKVMAPQIEHRINNLGGLGLFGQAGEKERVSRLFANFFTQEGGTGVGRFIKDNKLIGANLKSYWNTFDHHLDSENVFPSQENMWQPRMDADGRILNLMSVRDSISGGTHYYVDFDGNGESDFVFKSNQELINYLNNSGGANFEKQTIIRNLLHGEMDRTEGVNILINKGGYENFADLADDLRQNGFDETHVNATKTMWVETHGQDTLGDFRAGTKIPVNESHEYIPEGEEFKGFKKGETVIQDGKNITEGGPEPIEETNPDSGANAKGPAPQEDTIQDYVDNELNTSESTVSDSDWDNAETYFKDDVDTGDFEIREATDGRIFAMDNDGNRFELEPVKMFDESSHNLSPTEGFDEEYNEYFYKDPKTGEDMILSWDTDDETSLSIPDQQTLPEYYQSIGEKVKKYGLHGYWEKATDNWDSQQLGGIADNPENMQRFLNDYYKEIIIGTLEESLDDIVEDIREKVEIFFANGNGIGEDNVEKIIRTGEFKNFDQFAGVYEGINGKLSDNSEDVLKGIWNEHHGASQSTGGQEFNTNTVDNSETNTEAFVNESGTPEAGGNEFADKAALEFMPDIVENNSAEISKDVAEYINKIFFETDSSGELTDDALLNIRDMAKAANMTQANSVTDAFNYLQEIAGQKGDIVDNIEKLTGSPSLEGSQKLRLLNEVAQLMRESKEFSTDMKISSLADYLEELIDQGDADKAMSQAA